MVPAEIFDRLESELREPYYYKTTQADMLYYVMIRRISLRVQMAEMRFLCMVAGLILYDRTKHSRAS